MKKWYYKGFNPSIIIYFVEKTIDIAVKREILNKGIETYNFESSFGFDMDSNSALSNFKFSVFLNGYNEPQTEIILQIYKNKLGINRDFIKCREKDYEITMNDEEIKILFGNISNEVKEFADIVEYR